MAGSSVG